jgi:hypothetical protein
MYAICKITVHMIRVYNPRTIFQSWDFRIAIVKLWLG